MEKRILSVLSFTVVMLATCVLATVQTSRFHVPQQVELGAAPGCVPVVSSLIPVAPFIIDELGGGNYTWTSLRATEASWISGSGITSDPYIIDGIIIDVNQTIKYALVVNNSRVHFIIRNTSITDVLGVMSGDGAMTLSNTSNGRVTGCTFSDCGYAAIYIARGSNAISVDANTVTSCSIGFYLNDGIHDVVVRNNSLSDLANNGIALYSNCYDCDVAENVLVNGTGNGILISSGSMHIMVHKNILYNLSTGFLISGSLYNAIQENEITANDYGVFFSVYARNNLFTNNTIRDANVLVFLQQSNENIISCNGLYDAASIGVQLHNDCGWNSIDSNTISSPGTHGIYTSTNVFRNKFQNNTIEDAGEEGIFLDSSSHANEVIGNLVRNATWNGVRLFNNCDDNKIEGNTIEDCWKGVAMSSFCDFTSVTGNTIFDCDYEIGVVSGCSFVHIAGNHVGGSSIFGVSLDSSHGMVMGNLIEGATIEGLRVTGTACVIVENYFINNTVHATDYGTENIWIGGTGNKGNYWDDYSGFDMDGDGIGDEPYSLGGPSHSNDTLPIWDLQPPVFITIPQNMISEPGNVSNALVWTILDTSVAEPAYSLTINGTTVVKGTWASGTPIVFNIAHLAPGNYTVCITVTDGWDARFGLTNHTGLGGTNTHQVVICILAPRETLAGPFDAVTGLVIGLLVGAGGMAVVVVLVVYKYKPRASSSGKRAAP